MIDLTKNPPTLRLQWQGKVEVKKCIGCYGCKPKDEVYQRIILAGGKPYNACNGTGTVEREVVVDVNVCIASSLKHQMPSNRHIRGVIVSNGSVIADAESDIENPLSANPLHWYGSTTLIPKLLNQILTRYQNGEEIEGVEEYDKYRVRVKK